MILLKTGGEPRKASANEEERDMGLFDSIKKAFDAGGIAVDVDAPKTFRWADGNLPVTVTITGDDEHPRTVTAIELELEEEPSGTAEERNAARRNKRGIKQTFEQSLIIGAGETAIVELVFALNPVAAVGNASDKAVPEWLKAVAGAANVLADVTRDTPWYRLEATPVVEDFSARKSASQRIKNLRPGEWGDGEGISGSITFG